MRKALIVNNAPLSSDTGGTQIYSGMLFKGLLNRHIKTRYVGTGKATNKVITLSENPISHAKYTMRLIRIAKKTNNTVLFAQLSFFSIPFFMFKKNNKIVSVLHGDNIKAIRRKRGVLTGASFAFFEGTGLTISDKIIAVDESTKQAYVRRFPWIRKKTVVIHVGVDTELFKPLDREAVRKKHGFSSDEQVIIYVGRLRNDKRLDIIIKAYGIVKEKIPNSVLVVVGKGKDEEKYRKISESIGGKVIFLGEIPHDNMPEILNCADVFALASEYESGPLVVQEALACGVPCVVSDVGRVRNFIQNKYCGKVVGRNDVYFAQAIIELSQLDRKALKYECREASMKFNFDITVSKTLSIYTRISKPRGGDA